MGEIPVRIFTTFWGIALGSLAELETQLLLARQLGYLTEESINPVLQISDETSKMIKGLQKSLITN